MVIVDSYRRSGLWETGLARGLAGTFSGVLVLVMGFRSFPSLHSAWLGHPYAHGYLLVGAVGWVLYAERRNLEPRPGGWGPGPVLLVVLSMVWLFGAVTFSVGVHQLVLPMILVAGAATVLGRSSLNVLLPLLATYSFALPFWTVLVRPLQVMTTAAAGLLLTPLAIPFSIEGDVITIQYGAFLVARSCSGIAYFVSGSAIGALYAVLILRNWRTRIAAVVIAAALSVAANWIRVTSLIVIGHVTRMESGLMEDHGTFGWAVFAGALLVFFALASRLRDPGDSPSVAGTPTPPVANGVWTRRLFHATVLASIGPLSYALGVLLPWSESSLGPSIVPARDWSVESIVGSVWRPSYDGFDEHVSATWTIGGGSVQADELIYVEQRQGKELVHYENQIADETTVVLERLRMAGARVVNEAVVSDSSGPRLVWYWYRVGGVDTYSRMSAKALDMLAFVRRDRDARLVALSSPCAPGECTEAAGLLAEALQGMTDIRDER